MQRCQEGEAGAHSDAHTGTQAHAQKLMFRHEAAAGPEPEKHMHGPGLRREQADAARLTAAPPGDSSLSRHTRRGGRRKRPTPRGPWPLSRG